MTRKTKKAQPMDIIQEKEARLKQLEKKSSDAVSVVQITMDNLQMVNEDIQKTMDEIDTYVQRLSEARDALNATKTKNTGIMGNFAKLLCVE